LILEVHPDPEKAMSDGYPGTGAGRLPQDDGRLPEDCEGARADEL